MNVSSIGSYLTLLLMSLIQRSSDLSTNLRLEFYRFSQAPFPPRLLLSEPSGVTVIRILRIADLGTYKQMSIPCREFHQSSHSFLHFHKHHTVIQIAAPRGDQM